MAPATTPGRDPTVTEPPTGRNRSLIRTTGTTGAPKAARHDWRVLCPDRGRRAARAPTSAGCSPTARSSSPASRSCCTSLASQATLVRPFPRQPKDGLDALLAHGVDVRQRHADLLALSAGRGAQPPGAASRPWSRSRWAERPVPADLLEELRATFPVGPRAPQVYASTEFGSITSVKDGRPGISRRRAAGARRNPTSNVRVENGELWVRRRGRHARLRR